MCKCKQCPAQGSVCFDCISDGIEGYEDSPICGACFGPVCARCAIICDDNPEQVGIRHTACVPIARPWAAIGSRQ
jgi:hypothetical protein